MINVFFTKGNSMQLTLFVKNTFYYSQDMWDLTWRNLKGLAGLVNLTIG